MATSKFAFGDVVYLSDAASVGRLEKFKIVSLRQDPSGAWFYKFAVAERAPTGGPTMGDRITKKNSYDFELAENLLITLCDAVVLAKSYLTGELAKIDAIYQQFCSGS